MFAAQLFDRDDDGFVVAVDRAEQRVTGLGEVRELTQYQADFVGFCRDVLAIPEYTLRWSLNPGYDVHSWDGTADPLTAAADALIRWESVAIESGTGTGKSFWLALIILWFVACWRGARVFTFAPKEDQLRLYSWTEIRKLWPRFHARFPTAELTDLRIRILPGSDEWGVWGYPVQVKAGEEVSSHAAGMHAPHMLLVYEEGQGQPLPVVEAGAQTCTSPHNMQVIVGNPDHQQDTLHVTAERDDVVAIRISALDHPNVVTGDAELIPGAVSRHSIERRQRRYGADSRLYQSRIRGISPTEALDALIRQAWVNEAVARYGDPRFRLGLRALGVDCANSENGDKAAIADGLGACLLEVSSFPCPDASALGVRVGMKMALEGIDERNVGVDTVGVGASTYNQLKRMRRLVRSLNGGAKPEPSIDQDVMREDGRGVVPEELFGNLRSQMWWQMRMDLQHGRVALPDDEELHRDLTTPKWLTRNGKIFVESKEEIQKRLRRSPDKGDACVYWNFVRHRQELPEPPQEVSAWDEDMLAAEYEHGRRLQPEPSRARVISPTVLEHIP